MARNLHRTQASNRGDYAFLRQLATPVAHHRSPAHSTILGGRCHNRKVNTC
ncbi:MAG: hypothetical protein ACYC3S_12785 [Chloroflexota bacterium]